MRAPRVISAAALLAAAALASCGRADSAPVAVPPPAPSPAPAAPQVPPEEALRRVVAAIVAAARENAALEPAKRLKEDALAERYVRAACAASPDGRSAVIGLAFALDTTGLVTRNPVFAEAFKGAEDEAGRKERLAVVGQPTARRRYDWLMHFLGFGALALVDDESTAAAFGIQKEIADARGKERGSGSGFSFTDLAANYAGIEFALWIAATDGDARRARCAESFSIVEFLPEPTDLPDGLTFSEFGKRFGGLKDDRFKEMVTRLRLRVQSAPGYRQP